MPSCQFSTDIAEGNPQVKPNLGHSEGASNNFSAWTQLRIAILVCSCHVRRGFAARVYRCPKPTRVRSVARFGSGGEVEDLG